MALAEQEFMTARIWLFEWLYNALAMGATLLLINLFGQNLWYSQNTEEAEACVINRVIIDFKLKILIFIIFWAADAVLRSAWSCTRTCRAGSRHYICPQMLLEAQALSLD